MSSKSPTSLGELLNRGRLGDLVRKAGERRDFAAEIKARLPAEEAEHLVAASRAEDGALVLVMDSPAWAARVRYRAAELGAGPLRIKVVPR